ncbi:MAG: prolipoprotein diacylglyceryl transferase, partial [Rhodospirillales bacterium]|nr:prolipoprotein diacylglyceryl transferase [Rhodospirillales bacterium]
MAFAFTFPAIDPVLIEIGPIVIRWYALAYIAGLLLGWQLMRRLARSVSDQIAEIDVD